MKPLTKEWVDKAEGDYATMEREARVRKKPNHDAVCFHAQQCVEKYLKARLIEGGVEFAKIHDLVVLLDLVVRLEPLWLSHQRDFACLSAFAVQCRYPGEAADKEKATVATIACRRFRRIARESFGRTGSGTIRRPSSARRTTPASGTRSSR